MIFQAITTAIPGELAEGGEDRDWICFLACGHEVRLLGRVGRGPRKGRAVAACKLCSGEPDSPHEAPESTGCCIPQETTDGPTGEPVGSVVPSSYIGTSNQ